MQKVFIISDNVSFIESLKSSLVFLDHYGLKIIFLSNMDAFISEIGKTGLPDLLLCDECFARTWKEKSNFLVVTLSEKLPTSTHEIYIYQSGQGFIRDIRRYLSMDFVAVKSCTDRKNRKIWILSPLEGEWSKSCFKEMGNLLYILSKSAIVMDLSYFGNAVDDMNKQESMSLKNLLIDYYLGQDKKCEMDFQHCLFVEAGDHPMDTLAITLDFMEYFYEKVDSQQKDVIVYSGFLSMDLMKSMSWKYNEIYLLWDLDTRYDDKLQKIKEWLQGQNPQCEPNIIYPGDSEKTERQWAVDIIEKRHW